MLEILYYTIGLLAVITILISLYIKNKGDANIEFKVAERTAFEVVTANPQEVILSCKIPYINKGNNVELLWIVFLDIIYRKNNLLM